ncbi:hypothetical protein [Alkanindiges illinoisensis]|uniref:hypothetical protein n=1 Tax=Alkanindiges illinoisensis TaxID=197183 RepID=UPI0006849681|nr:hypothetical protein [Alkanindiges illinoisensis]
MFINNQLKYCGTCAVLTLLTACQQPSQPQQSQQPQSQQQASKATVNIPVYEYNGISASARLTGILTLKNGCLYADGSLLIFPENLVKWDEVNQILTYMNRNYRIGQQVDFAGGSGKFKKNANRIKYLNPQCTEEYVWLVG